MTARRRSCFSRQFWARHRAAEEIRACRRRRDEARARGDETGVHFHAFCAHVEMDKAIWAGLS